MPDKDPKRILVVDDNRVNRLVLEQRLQKQGFEVDSVASGIEALQSIGLDEAEKEGETNAAPDSVGGSDHPTPMVYDAVVLDVMMPNIDGLEVLRRIREVHSTSELPVIMATAKHQSADIVQALDLGANDYVVKPIDMPVLVARLGTHVLLRRTHLALKEAQSSLIAAAKMESVGYLAAGVAHEVRNPLAQIQLGIDSIKSSQAAMSDPDIQAVIPIVTAAIEKADAITRELMRVSTSGKLELTDQSINDLIEEVLEATSETARQVGVEISLKLEPQLPLMPLASSEMRSVLNSVITNAIEAMPDGGELTINTRVDTVVGIVPDQGKRTGTHLRQGEECVVIEIIDSGPGIEAQKLASVFDPFRTSKATGKGTGLGLSIARKVVELHHGTMSLQNRARHSGIRVMIQLPKASALRTTV